MRGVPDCPRGLPTCIPLDNVIADDPPMSSFVCCGYNDGSEREVAQDYMTLCIKNAVIDTHEHVDRYDLLDQAAVITSAMSMDERAREQWAGDPGDHPEIFGWLKEQMEQPE